MSQKSLHLSIIVPFKDFGTLINNMMMSFEHPDDCYEVIFVHDSSQRLEKHQIELLLQPNLRSKYFQGEFGSPGLARNKGLDEASGKWIVFWDSDDFGFPNKLCKCIREVTENVVIGNFYVSHENKLKTSNIAFTSLQTQVALNPGIWRFIFKSEVAKKYRFMDLKLGEDIIYLMESGALSLSRVILNDTIYEYRISAIQSTRNMNVESNLLDFLDVMVKKIVQSEIENAIVFGIFWRQIFSLIKVSKGRQSLQCLKFVLRIMFYLGARDKLKFIQQIKVVINKGIV